MIKGPVDNPSGTGYRGGGFNRSGGFDDDWNWPSRRMDRQKLEAVLFALVKNLEQYDEKRRALENRAVTPAMLLSTMELLKHQFEVEVLGRKHTVALVDQASVRGLLRDLWDYECRLEIRTCASGMPLYYVPRIWHDYDSVYSLVLEDIYQSPGYPMADERFVKIMWGGHEIYFIRLSPFRKALLNGRDPLKEPDAEDEVDTLLRKVGRLVFQACWHEDQYVGMVAADQFDLVNFRRAVELLYLSLTAELCELRSGIDEAMLRFFKDIYPQPVIEAFLNRLTGLDGKALAEVPQAALKHFPGLSRAFSRFLAVELPWGRSKTSVPLYKLLFANFSRMETLRNAITEKEELLKAGELLEKQSLSVIDALLDNAGKAGLEPDPNQDRKQAVAV
jgi:hypothetical protein